MQFKVYFLPHMHDNGTDLRPDNDAPDADVTALGIRKNPPFDHFLESTMGLKQPRFETTGSRKRVRASDFDNLTQRVLNAAINEYRVIVCTKDPFPDLASNRDICAQVWRNACVSRNVQIQLSEEIIKLV
jgi:hypothetical protein